MTCLNIIQCSNERQNLQWAEVSLTSPVGDGGIEELSCNNVLAGTLEPDAEDTEQWTGKILLACLDSTPVVIQENCEAVS